MGVGQTWNGSGQVFNFSYNIANSLCSEDGLRQRKQSGGTTTFFVWDAQNLLLEQE